MHLNKLQQPSLTDMVENKIREAITENSLKPGDSLPGEVEFSEKLGVSRNIVREALSRLRMLGILESRRRRGLILTEPKLLNGLDTILSLSVLSDKSMKQLLQLRVVTEIGMCHLVHRNKTESDIAYLEELVSIEESNPDSQEVSTECDVNFHCKLFEMSANDTLIELHNLVRPFITSHAKGFRADRFSNGEVSNHRIVLDALKQDCPHDFCEAMTEHLSIFL